MATTKRNIFGWVRDENGNWKPPKPAAEQPVTDAEGHTLYEPPFLSYDPAIAAERRAAERGLEDIEDDTERDSLRARQDYGQARRDIRLGGRRERRDIATKLRRGRQDLRFKGRELQTKKQRGREDFGTQLNNLRRRFTLQGQEQGQAANAQGVLGGGTLAASAQRRGENFGIARQSLDTGLARMLQDARVAETELGIAGRQLRQDTRRGRTEERQDRRRDQKLTRLEFRRGKHDRFTDLQRARREWVAADADLLSQMIWQARMNNPGAFTKAGRKKGGRK
jgi:hypothetical protein